MAQAPFLQNVVAVVWDFDKTLTPRYMQDPLFRKYGVEGWAADKKSGFWDEVNALPAFYQARGLGLVSKDVLYLDHILTYVREGKFPGLTNRVLRELGGQIEFYPGVPAILEKLKARPAELNLDRRPHNITVEHYVVSTGLRQMITGSAVAPHIEKAWACEFVESIARPGFLVDPPSDVLDQPVAQVGYSIDNTTKTRAIFEINKGANFDPDIDVNSPMKHEHRRVPFQNMIYIADGPSDVPVFSVVRLWGGKTFAVYPTGDLEAFAQAKSLQDDERVHGYGPADYQDGTQTAMWLTTTVDEMISHIATEREIGLKKLLGKVPSHLSS